MTLTPKRLLLLGMLLEILVGAASYLTVALRGVPPQGAWSVLMQGLVLLPAVCFNARLMLISKNWTMSRFLAAALFLAIISYAVAIIGVTAGALIGFWLLLVAVQPEAAQAALTYWLFAGRARTTWSRLWRQTSRAPVAT